MKRYGKYSEKYERIINGTGLPVKKKRIRRLLLTTCNKSLPCVQPLPLLSNKIGKGTVSPILGIYFLRYHDYDVNENVKKTIRWIGRKTTVHAFFTLFCTFLYRHYMTMTWKCLISRFTEDINKRRRKFLPLSELGYGCLEFGSKRVRLHLTK